MASMTAGGIAYDDVGQGDPALLFLPGWCGPRTLFEPLLAPLVDVRRLNVDWRGHGESRPADADFGNAELVADALEVIETAGAAQVVPVAAAHAGWVAIELRRRLGATRVPRLVLLDWMVLGAPPPFIDALVGMADPATTRVVVDQVTDLWLPEGASAQLTDYVGTMAATPDEMWARAARAISAAFAEHGAPLDAIAALDPPPPTLHLYAQPPDPELLAAQEAAAVEHPWFSVVRLDAGSHFPALEVPGAVAQAIHRFVLS